MLAIDADLAIDGSSNENYPSSDDNNPPEEESVDELKREKAQLKREREQLRLETNMWRTRALFMHRQNEEQTLLHDQQLSDMKQRHEYNLSDLNETYNTQLSGMRQHYDETTEEIKVEILRQKEAIDRLKKENAQLDRDSSEARSTLEEYKKELSWPLRYDDLYEEGILSRHVKAFTLFDTVEQNDAFLDILNYADGSDGSFEVSDGLCENLRPYSHVERSERSGEVPPPVKIHGSEDYMTYLKRSKAARQSFGRTWKDDYLSWCIYVRAGTTQEFAACISGISSDYMSDIFHGWAQILDDALQRWFPRPTRSQLLRNYPCRFFEADGHARCFMLLDAFEIFTQTSSNPDVSSSTHSEYKKHCTVKFLGGTDPIGCPWNATVPDGNPGRASDVLVTKDTKILRQVPFGYHAKVDKGFIVDNDAADDGVLIDRPQKRLKKQAQQSTVDTLQTQKVGNTRIIVENVNGELKLEVRYLNVLIPTLHFPIISKIVRIGYLLQNFKKAIIQNNYPRSDTPYVGLPARGEIRWYGEQSGATVAGLMNLLADVQHWGLQCEVDRHAKLMAMEEHRGKTRELIRKIVLSERWDLKMRRELYELRDEVYDGGDL